MVAGFRERYFPTSTVETWAKALTPFDFEMAKAVAVELYTERYDEMPSLRQVRSAMAGMQRQLDRVASQRELADAEGVPMPTELAEWYWLRHQKALPSGEETG